ncbi:MAG: tape measure protein [Xanthomonadaceae bacterium]|jgi:tape measure domain-containing protein|nr:tape measure protein [Xanthomonadaceae bacterium]
MSLALTLRINADGSNARNGLRGVVGDLNNVGAAARKAGTDARQGGEGIAQAGTKAEQAGNRAKGAAGSWSLFSTALGSIAIGATVAGLVRMADAMTNLDARLKITAGSANEYARANGLVFDIAQRTRSEIGATAALYSRLTQSLKETGASQAEVARLTETINKAFQVSGATTTEAAAATVQLAQGLAAGALRGDEFNSVAEQAPAIMDALAKSLGVSRGELRAMAEDGKITASAVRQALGEAAADIDQKFAQMPVTIGGALTQLSNSLQMTVGWFNKAGGASNIVVQGIDFIRTAIELLPGMLLVVRGAFAEWWESIKFGFQALGLQIKIAMATALDVVRIAIAEQIARIALSLKNIPVDGAQRLADGLAKSALALRASATQSGQYRKELAELSRQHGILIDAIQRRTGQEVLAFEAQRKAIASTVEGTDRTEEATEADIEAAAAKKALAAAIADLDAALKKNFREGLAPARQGTEAASRAMQQLTSDIRVVPDFAAAAAQALATMNATAKEPAPSEFADSWLSAADSVASAIADFAASGLGSFREFADAMKNIARRLISDLIYTFLRNRIIVPITAQITGQGGGGGIAGGIGQALGAGGGGGILGTVGSIAGALGFGGFAAGTGVLGATIGATGSIFGGLAATTQFGLASLAAGNVGVGLGALAGPIGLAVAALSLLAGALKDTTRRITVIGSELVGTPGYRNLAPDAVRQSALGGFAFASIDNVGREERDQLAQAIQQFDASIAQLLDEDQLQRVKDAVAQINTQATEGAITADTFIRQRFDAVLSTMSDAVRAFVAEGETFEDQVQRLGQALQFPREIQAVIDGFAREDLLANMTELERRTLEVNERFDAAIDYLTERSATEEQLAQVEAFRARALAALTEATEDSVDGLVRDAARIGDMLDRLRFEESLVGLSDLDRQLAILAQEANEAALAAAALGANEAELAEIREIFTARRARLEQQSAQQALDAAADYWAQIAAYNQQAMQQVADAIRSAFGGLADFLRGEMFGETSTLTPAEQFAAAQEQFQDTLRRAAAGDQNAAQGIQGAAQRLLEQALSFLGGGDAYRQLREAVLGSLGPLAALGQSGSADSGALAGGPAAALRRFLELMRGFGIGPNAVGVGGLGFGPAANGALTVPQGLSLPGVGGGSGNALSVSPLVLDRSFAVQDQQLQRLTAVETELRELRRDFVRTGEGVREAIQRTGYGARFG